MLTLLYQILLGNNVVNTSPLTYPYKENIFGTTYCQICGFASLGISFDCVNNLILNVTVLKVCWLKLKPNLKLTVS